jgi:isoamylase
VSDGSEKGDSSPLGATPSADGVNFSVFSRHATGVELLLFDGVDATKAASVVRLDPSANRTYYYWHVFVPNVRPGQLYGYRVEGPFDPSSGMRFDPAKVLLDPYGRGVMVPSAYDRAAARRLGDNTGTAMKSVVVDVSAYDWEGDAPLQRPSSRTIVYEMHVRGFTRHPSSGLSEKTRGTFAGLIEKIPYLQRLGITAVELLPVFQFDRQDSPPGLVNYWGYAPVSFFAPTEATAHVVIRSVQSTNFATWSRPCIEPVSRSSSTSCSTTPPKGTTRGRSWASGEWTTRRTTFWKRIARATRTTAVPGTRSTPITPSFGE